MCIFKVIVFSAHLYNLLNICEVLDAKVIAKESKSCLNEITYNQYRIGDFRK